MKNSKSIAVIATAAIMILAFFVLSLALPEQAYSESERRKLAQKAPLSLSSVFRGDYFPSLEDYALDRFPLRESFRRLKAVTALYLLGQRDNNGLYTYNGGIYKLSRSTDLQSVARAADRYKRIQSEYLGNCNVYFSIIPDKSYYVFAENGYPHLDYDKIFSTMLDSLGSMKYIDITARLQADDYYLTDVHWRQESIEDAARALLDGMSARAPRQEFTARRLEGFKGSYYGQWALPVRTDTLICLSSDILENVRVYDYEKKAYIPVYSPEKFTGIDPYDVYLSGARALLRMENPAAEDDRELYIFRDSFASSLAPLLCESYSAVTLIDLRYITLPVLFELIDIPDGSDALFLHNTLLLNDSSVIIKG